MASHLNDYFSPFVPVTSEHVTFTAGVTGLNEMIALSLTNEGEGILLGRPIYGSFNGDLITKSRWACHHPSETGTVSDLTKMQVSLRIVR
jgi:bifunctional pyridoxal-dependent enzyme with beta-cystathionase and maltose regulon repressor activities